MLGILLYHFLSYSFETASFIESGAQLAASKLQLSSCLQPSQPWSYRCIYSYVQLFTQGPGFELRSLYL